MTCVVTITNAQANIIYAGFGQPGGSSTSYSVPSPNIVLYTTDASNPPNVTNVFVAWTNGPSMFFKHSEHYAVSNMLALFPPLNAGAHYPQYFMSKVANLTVQ